MNNTNYLAFHSLKKEIINKFNSIEDGSRMDALCDNFLEETTVSECLDDVKEMFEELQRLELILIVSEED